MFTPCSWSAIIPGELKRNETGLLPVSLEIKANITLLFPRFLQNCNPNWILIWPIKIQFYSTSSSHLKIYFDFSFAEYCSGFEYLKPDDIHETGDIHVTFQDKGVLSMGTDLPELNCTEYLSIQEMVLMQM